MVYSCCVPGCKNFRSIKHRIPIVDDQVYNTWLKRIGNNALIGLKKDDVYQRFRVCNKHFSDFCFVPNTNNKKLKVGSLPTLFLPSYTGPDNIQTCMTSQGPQKPVTTPNTTNKEISDKTTSIQESGDSSITSTPKYTPNPSNKFSFLLENKESLTNSNSSVGSTSKKLTSSIHQTVTSRLLKLKNVLRNERYLLQKLNSLYRNDKFNYICKQLQYLSNEFIKSRLENANQSTASKWNKKDHCLALSLYIKNEKLYKYLCTHFSLPPENVLKLILCRIPFKAGISEEIMRLMKKSVIKMNTGDRICVLMMIEMPITLNLRYDEVFQQLYGYEDLDYLGRCAKEADRVMILMIRGLRKEWRQVVGYYFGSGPFKNVNVQNAIIATIKKLQTMGLNVVALVCDQNRANLKTLLLLSLRNSSYFTVNSKRISIIFNVPHLLVKTRNALTKCKILYEEKTNKTAKLEHIESAYSIDQAKRIFKQLHKLEDQYFSGKNLNSKTRFAAAKAILSHTVAAAIETFVLNGDLPREAIQTAEFVEIVDMLFDSLNGSQTKSSCYKKYSCALSANSGHLRFWSSILAQMNEWKLIDLNTEKDVTHQYSFIRGWQITMESIAYIWGYIQREGYFNHILLNRFNLEPIESLFESITQYNTNSSSPTCYQFVNALKCEVVNGNEDPYSANYYNLTALGAFVTDIFNEDLGRLEDLNETYFDDLNLEIINTLGLHEAAAYLSGYLLQKVNIPECEDCRLYLLADWVLNKTDVETLKDYSDDSAYELYASDHVVRIVDKILYLLQQFLRDHSEKMNLEDTFKSLYKQELEAFKFCSVHRINEDLIDLCIKLAIYRFTYCFNNRKLNK